MKAILMITSVFCISALAVVFTVSKAQSSTLEPNGQAQQSQGYYSAKDLNTYINQLNETPKKIGDYYFGMAKASEECAIFGINASYAKDSIHSLEEHPNVPNASIKIAMLKRLDSRCSTFAQANTHALADIASLFARAALDGNVPAMAHNLVVTQSLQLPTTAIRNRAIAIIETKNPIAMFELGTLFESGGPLELRTNVLINGNESALAWRLAACKLGLNCAFSSALVQQVCLSGGPCGTGSYVENVRSDEASPQTFHQITKVVTQILDAVRSNNVSNLIIARHNQTFIQNTLSPQVKAPYNPSQGGGGGQTVDLSSPIYSHIGPGFSVNSIYIVRAGTDTAANYAYDSYNEGDPLKMGQTFKVKYKDGSEETVLVVLPEYDGSSVAVAPIPGTGISSTGVPMGSDGTVIISKGTAGASVSWTCVTVGTGRNKETTCSKQK